MRKKAQFVNSTQFEIRSMKLYETLRKVHFVNTFY